MMFNLRASGLRGGLFIETSAKLFDLRTLMHTEHLFLGSETPTTQSQINTKPQHCSHSTVIHEYVRMYGKYCAQRLLVEFQRHNTSQVFHHVKSESCTHARCWQESSNKFRSGPNKTRLKLQPGLNLVERSDVGSLAIHTRASSLVTPQTQPHEDFPPSHPVSKCDDYYLLLGGVRWGRGRSMRSLPLSHCEFTRIS
ncbi:hypothetical protein ABKN59_005948 [Abortiporus biennis]